MPREILLTKGMSTIVDDSDFEWLSQWKWCFSRQGYAVRRGEGGTIVLMHRVIMGDPANGEIDHSNGLKTDNRRSNLRLATHSENNRNKGKQSNNKSGYKGVTFRSDLKRPWRSHINVVQDENHGRKQINLGSFHDPSDAAVAYDVGALKYFGEFAFTNFPRENYAEIRSWDQL